MCAGRSATARTLVSADDWTGTWRGTYVCYQGATGLFLNVKRSGDNEVAAIFSFFAVPENPGVPSGEFEMTGRPGPQGDHLQLFPSAWITRPPGYVMVELDGDYDESSGAYSGRVLAPGCTRFILRRDQVS
jgi:hypothetical protein